jgi:hypothetical protein
MVKIRKNIFVGVAALIALAASIGPASARTRIEVSTSAFLTHGRITFIDEGGATYQVCDITLHVTARRLINKVRGELIGHVTSILTANAGAFTTCRGLVPMLVMYDSERGVLPNPTGGTIRFRGGWLFTNPFGRCLFEMSIPGTSGTNPIRTLAVSSAVGDIRLLTNLGGSCPEELSMSATMTARPEVTIRLLER